MREILFRGKRDDGEWVEGYFVHCKSIYDDETGRTAEIIPHNADRIYDGEYCPNDVHKVILKTVGQFTGLTDKNGKKIFEGDICQVCLDPGICTAHIKYGKRTASFNMLYDKYTCSTFLDMRLAENRVGDRVWIKVIGNIHDNPELLEANQ
jgi:uncharacterized phage protein (TIGR01671 family)